MLEELQESTQTFISALKLKFKNLYTNLGFDGKIVAE
jgi:hypothetical protein